MLLYKTEDFIRLDLLSRPVQIDQKDSGVIILVIRAKPELVDVVRQLGFPRMGGRRKEMSLQIRLPERAERINDQDIRIKVQDAARVLRQKFRCEEPVIHLPGILAAHRRAEKGAAADLHRAEAEAVRTALAADRLQGIPENAAVYEPDVGRIVRLIDAKRGDEHLQAGEIVLVERREDLHSVRCFLRALFNIYFHSV